LAEKLQSSNTAVYKWQLGSPLRHSSKEMVHQWLRDNGWLDRAQESDEEPPSAEPTRAPRKAPKRHQAAIDALNALPEKHRDAAAEAFGRRLAELALGE
ncbi:MAG TPA: hypothetical protein VLV83_24090, partial [Acidobacteriota bacterium]|nr:hypothetical protein [Acidobacteriota bacterium]